MKVHWKIMIMMRITNRGYEFKSDNNNNYGYTSDTNNDGITMMMKMKDVNDV